MKRDGFAILIVLWLLVPLSLLFLTLSTVARSDGKLAGNLRAAAVLQAAADGGIETATFELLRGAGPAPLASAPLTLVIGGVPVSVSVESLSGLVNPNLAQPELLRALFRRLGVDPAASDSLAVAIVDWRTKRQTAREGEASAARYRAAGLDYGPPGAPFEALGELRLVLGMSPTVLQSLRPLLTLATDVPPEPSLAPPPIRAALNDLGIRPTGPPRPGTVFRLSATAGGTVTRAATVRLEPRDPTRPQPGRPWRILAWD